MTTADRQFMELAIAMARRCKGRPDDPANQLEELNHTFIRSIESSTVHCATQEIAQLATRPGSSRQRDMAALALRDCLNSLRCINRGELRIAGREAGYFGRWLERL